MKKIIAAFLALVLCLSVLPAAFATDVGEITWEMAEELISKNGIKGEFVEIIENTGLKMWLLDGMTEQEVDEDYSNETGLLKFFCNEDESRVAGICFFQMADENFDMEALKELLADQELQEVEYCTLNGKPCMTYAFIRDDGVTKSYCVDVILGGGFLLEATFTGDEEYMKLASLMAASIQE